MPRAWGFWTKQKLEILEGYLAAFATASKRAPGTLYLDLFAGGPRNVSRETGEQMDGSPRVALSTLPHLTKVVLFDLPRFAGPLESELRNDFPGRDIVVHSGDCNVTIERALAELDDYRRAPTFALVDQFAAEVTWTTLKRLAEFKRDSRYKAELWLLFAPSMLPRGLSADQLSGNDDFAARVDRMMGTQEWRTIWEARAAGWLDPPVFRDKMLNLMRWRLENELGYRRTHAFEMKNATGTPLYTMIFATDNAAGDRIMSHLYKQAAERQPGMRGEARTARAAARDEAAGQFGLFDPPPAAARPDDLVPYVHTPPQPPFCSGRG